MAAGLRGSSLPPSPSKCGATHHFAAIAIVVPEEELVDEVVTVEAFEEALESIVLLLLGGNADAGVRIGLSSPVRPFPADLPS